MKLTGRTRYRLGWFGRLVLQVEYQYRTIPAFSRVSPDNFTTLAEWRDATIDDVLSGVVPPLGRPEEAS